MDILGEAPSLILLIGLSWGLGLGKGDSPLFFSLVSCFVAMAVMLVVQARWDRRRLVFALIMAVLTFALSMACLVPLSLFRLNEPSASRPIDSQGVILTERPWGYARAWILKSEGHKYMTKVPVERSLSEGTVVSFSGEVVPLRKKKDDNSFDEKMYWFAKGIEGELILTSSSPVENSRNIGTFRTALRRRILLSLPPLTRGHVLAAVLGVRDPDLAEKHSRWGTSHLLAVSGFHVGIMFLLACLLPLKGWPRWLAVSLILWLYVAVAGASASALRAAVMAQAAVLGIMYGRPASGVNSVALAAVVLLLISPWQFWDLGWRLSVICAATVSAVMTLKRCRRAAGALLSGPVLWFATAPLIAQAFGSVPLAGMVLNLIALPFFSVLFPLAVVCSIPALLGIPGGWWLACVSEWGFHLWELGADVIGALPSLAFQPWMVFCSLFVLAAVFVLRFRVSFFRAGLFSMSMACLAMTALS